MNGIRFAENMLIRPLYQGLAAANDVSSWCDVSKAQWVTFYITTGTNDTNTTFRVECSSAASTNASCENVSFWYRVSGACSTAGTGLGADTWGAITTADSAGFALAEGDSFRGITIDVDPAMLPVLNANFRYLRIETLATAYATTPALSVTAFIEPRSTNRTYST